MYRFLTIILGLIVISVQAKETGKHLFILSGQSNMTGVLNKAFTAKAEEQFGAENVIVVQSSRSGRGIRFWVKDYQYADGVELSSKKNSCNGEEYPRLIKAAQDGLNQHKYESVSFVWMQGESDANSTNKLSKVYAVNFNKLYKKLKTDLKLEKLYFVIGRISNYGLLKTTKNYSLERAQRWTEVRTAQVQVAQNHSHGDWIDTDDLIDDTNIHYNKTKQVTLGERFATKVIALIQNGSIDIIKLEKGDKAK